MFAFKVAAVEAVVLLLGTCLLTPALSSPSSASYGLVVARFLASRQENKCEYPLEGSWPLETAKAVGRVGAELVEKVRQTDSNGNVLFSPLSISSAFALVYFGARGQTKQELEEVFGFWGGRVPSMLMEKSKMFGEGSEYGARVANRAYLSKGAQVQKCYAKAVTPENVQLLDFAWDSNGSRSLINNYVDRVTEGHIKDMIPPGLISSQTQMVLANAVYFQGGWTHGFPKELTHKKKFRAVSGDQWVDFMTFRTEKSMNYRSIPWLQSEIIELPYKGGRFSMFIILPSTSNGWRNVEQKLKYANVQYLFSFQSKLNLILQMPKWKMDMEVQGVKNHLAAMGLSTVFSSSSDLSGITSDRSSMVTDVIHKAKIIVDEEGTTAAAATAAIAARTVFAPKYLTIDRPFLFFIVDKTDSVIFFQGTVTGIGRKN